MFKEDDPFSMFWFQNAQENLQKFNGKSTVCANFFDKESFYVILYVSNQKNIENLSNSDPGPGL